MLDGPIVIIIMATLGALAGSLIDAFARRWRPSLAVPAALGHAQAAHATGWSIHVPLGWLALLPGSKADRLTAMRAATEVVGAGAFALIAATSGDVVQLGLRSGLVAVFLMILRIDWQYHLIQDQTILVGLLIALGGAALQSLGALLGALLAGAAAALVFFGFYMLARVIYRQSALGFGDVLLAGLIGAAVGPQAVLGTLFLGMLLAALGGIVVALVRGRTLRTYFAYGTYLAAAAIITISWPYPLASLPGFFF